MELLPGDARLLVEKLESGDFSDPGTCFMGDYRPEEEEQPAWYNYI